MNRHRPTSKIVFSLILTLSVITATAQDKVTYPDAPEPKIHSFWDRQNVTSLSVLALFEAGDAYTTADLQGHGYREMNPLARPLVHTRAGNFLYFSSSVGAVIGEMKLAHHLEQAHPGHARLFHFIERAVPWGNVLFESYFVQRNSRLILNLRSGRHPVPGPSCGPSACLVVSAP